MLSTPFTSFFAAAALVALALASGCGNIPTSPVDQQRQWARGLEPESIKVQAGPPVQRTLKLRAYIDDRYAALDAEGRARQAVADAGAILAAQARIGLEIVEVRRWTHTQSDVFAVLEELRAADAEPDDSVDLVVGFIGPAPAFTESLHLLGAARLLGQHLVARGMNDVVEISAIDRFLSAMPAEERSELIERRSRHKAAIVLLHEVAHALGGVHVTDTEAVLSPTYSLSQNRLNEDALALIELGLAFHDARDDAGRKSAADALREQVGRRRERLDSTDADEAMAMLEQRAQIATGALVLPPEEARKYNDAVAKWRNKELAAAFALARELAVDPKAHAQVLALACALASADGVVALDGPTLCARAVKASPALAPANDALRMALKTNLDVPSAFALALERRKGAPADDVLELASLARSTGRLAVVEQTLDGIDDERATKMRNDVRVLRGRIGLQAGKLNAEDEVAYQGTLKSIYDAMNDAKRIVPLLDETDARYGEIAGLLAVRCDVLRRMRKTKDAEKACARAAELMPDASFVFVVRALIEADKGRRAQAIEHLERAAQLDPEYPPTQELLAKLKQR